MMQLNNTVTDDDDKFCFTNGNNSNITCTEYVYIENNKNNYNGGDNGYYTHNRNQFKA